MDVMTRLHADRTEELTDFVLRLDQRFDNIDQRLDFSSIDCKLDTRYAQLAQLLGPLVAASKQSGVTTPNLKQSRSANSTPARSNGHRTTQRNAPSSSPARKSRTRTIKFQHSTSEMSSATEHLPQPIGWFSSQSPGSTPLSTDKNCVEDHSLVKRTEIAAQLLSNWLAVIFTLSITAAYQHPTTRNAVLAQLQTARRDPLLATLFGCVIAAIVRCLLQTPRQILSLSDDTISLRTALGEDLRVPSYYWKANEIFHGFLESHFRDRPGKAWVTRKSYRILVGGSRGIVVHASKWSSVVSKRAALTMAMVLDKGTICPRCGDVLVQSTEEERYW
jgi:hypothetical protein